jgi:integrase/recombinase XerD
MDIGIRELEKHLKIRNYSPSTIKTYVDVVKRMCYYCNKPSNEINEYDYKLFVESLVNETKLGWNTIHMYHAGISYFFKEILKIENYKQFVRYPKRIVKMPVIMSYTEIRLIFDHVTNFKHNTILKLFYSTGIRSRELRKLTIDCIDFERQTILIKSGKGQKDRYVAISTTMHSQLVQYIRKYQPTVYLFEATKGRFFSPTGIRFILWQAKNKLNIKKKINIHSFRHTYATHMLEQGGNILVLQRLLGHVQLRSTLVYLHTQNIDITRAPNPLDNLCNAFYDNQSLPLVPND